MQGPAPLGGQPPPANPPAAPQVADTHLHIAQQPNAPGPGAVAGPVVRVLNRDAPLTESGNPIADLTRLARIDPSQITKLDVSMAKKNGNWDVGHFLAPPDNKVCLKAVMEFTATLDDGSQVVLLATRYTNVSALSDDPAEEHALMQLQGGPQQADVDQVKIANMTRFLRAIESDARGFETIFKDQPTVNDRATNINTFVNNTPEVISRVRVDKDTTEGFTVSHQWVNVTGTALPTSPAFKVSQVARQQFNQMVLTKAPGTPVDEAHLYEVTSVNPQQVQLSQHIKTMAQEIVGQLPPATGPGAFPQEIETEIDRRRDVLADSLLALDLAEPGAEVSEAADGVEQLTALLQDPDITAWLAGDEAGMDHLAARGDEALAQVRKFVELNNQFLNGAGSPAWSAARAEMSSVANSDAASSPVNARIVGGLDAQAKPVHDAMKANTERLKGTSKLLADITARGKHNFADPDEVCRVLAEATTQHVGRLESDLTDGALTFLEERGQELIDDLRYSMPPVQPTPKLWLQEIRRAMEGPAHQELSDHLAVWFGGPGANEALDRIRENYLEQRIAALPQAEQAAKRALWMDPKHAPALNEVMGAQVAGKMDELVDEMIGGLDIRQRLGAEADVYYDQLSLNMNAAMLPAASAHQIKGDHDLEARYRNVLLAPELVMGRPGFAAMSDALVFNSPNLMAYQLATGIARGSSEIELQLLRDLIIKRHGTELMALVKQYGLPTIAD